jgi:PhzF family phenazine biosynthesis protein
MPVPLYQVDGFTSKPFAGNPAAVCLLDEPAAEEWMQNVAAEMNLSETAFVVDRGDPLELRWFTPSVEVALCGHATLASAHVPWESGRRLPSEDIRFQTRSGELICRRSGDRIEMDFPATPAEAHEPPAGLIEGLGVAPVWTGRNRADYLIELKSEEAVRAASPDFRGLSRLPVRGVIVTARCGGGPYDFVSRFFAPGSGIDEDPVTGSAHCTLAPYWGAKLDRTELTSYQASARGGEVQVRLAGDRVRLLGRAATVLAGRWVGLASL